MICTAQNNSGDVEDIQAKLAHAASEAVIVHRDERLLEWKKTEFPQIEALNRDFDPYATLWSVAFQFVTNEALWLQSEFRTLDGEAIDGLVLDWYRRSYKLTKFFVNRPGLQKVAEWTKKRVRDTAQKLLNQKPPPPHQKPQQKPLGAKKHWPFEQPGNSRTRRPGPAHEHHPFLLYCLFVSSLSGPFGAPVLSKSYQTVQKANASRQLRVSAGVSGEEDEFSG
eukprot:2068846-Pyramimonas_sp.AAC.1